MTKHLVICAVLLRARRRSLPQAQQKVDFMLNWVPGGDHAPYYYAKKLGWYAKEGIDLNLEPGKGSALATQRVGAGATPDRPGRHGRRAGRQGQGRRHGGGVQRLCQLAAGHVLAEELGHHGRQGLPRQEDRQPGRRRRARDVAGARQGERHRPEIGHLGEHRRQRQAVRAEGQVDRRHHLVLQHPPHLPAGTGRRHGLPRLARRRASTPTATRSSSTPSSWRRTSRWSTSSSRSRSAPSPPASRTRSPACRR